VRRLVLVFPPQYGLLAGFSTGLVSLADFVGKRMADVSVSLLDLAEVPIGELDGRVRAALGSNEDEPLVGITTTTASYQAALDVARSVKQQASRCKVMLGGPHATAQDQLILERHQGVVDFVVRGEGEKPLLDLLRCYPDVDSVLGLTFRSGNSIRRNPLPAPLSQDELDSLDVTYSATDVSAPPGKFDHVTYVSSRGCHRACAFCCVGGRAIGSKSVSRVVEDLRVLVSEMGFRSVAIEDNFFAHSPNRTLQLCRALETLQAEADMGFSWDCQTRVESVVRPDIVAAMARAGCEAVYLGVETLSPPQLLYLRKTQHPDQYLAALHDIVVPELLASSISVYLTIQLGIPGESNEDRTASLMALRRLGRMAQSAGRTITVFPQLHVVYPGSPLFTEGITNKRFPSDVFEDFTKWEARQRSLKAWLGEQFAHGSGGIPEGILVPDKLQQGQFEVDARGLSGVAAHLEAMRSIGGIRVFAYGRYLTRPVAEDPNELMTTGAHSENAAAT